MADRRRLGVSLWLPEPASAEVDGLRRAFGDPARRRIAPHITVIAPFNARVDEFDEVVDGVHDAVHDVHPLRLTIGPGDTFAPTNPVVFLAVGGADREVLDRLHRRLRRRDDRYAFHPHVTLHRDVADESLAALIVAAQHYERDVTIAAVEVVELLTDDDGLARWRSVESIALVAPRVIGRGGLEARIVRREHGGLLECLAVRDGEQIGAAHLWLPSARLLDVTVAPVARREGAARHLLIAVEQAAREAGCESLVADAHPFLEHHGWHADAGGQCRRWLGQL